MSARTDGGRDTRSIDQIRADIARSREQLGADIEAAKLKLSPRGLQEEAVSRIRGARGRANSAVDRVGDRAQEQVSHMSDGVVGFLKGYPVGTTLVGLGIAALALGGSSRHSSRTRRSRAYTGIEDGHNEGLGYSEAPAAELPPPRR